MNSIENSAAVLANLPERHGLVTTYLGSLLVSEKKGPLDERTREAIKGVCERHFEGLRMRYKKPLHSNDGALFPARREVRKIVATIKRLDPKLYKEESVRNLRDFARCPELIEARLAAESGIYPKKAGGAMGAYIFYNRLGQPWGVFKAAFSTFTFSRFNPLYQRERVAYLLDLKADSKQFRHYCRVPKTVVTRSLGYMGASMDYTKGSFQRFIPSKNSKYDDYVKNLQTMPAEEFHRHLLFDLRLSNEDRHLNNLIIDRKGCLRPIDNALILGEFQASLMNLAYYPQAKTPFSQRSLAYIEQLDIGRDSQLLQRVIPSLKKETLLRFQWRTVLLKKAAKLRLNLFQIDKSLPLLDHYLQSHPNLNEESLHAFLEGMLRQFRKLREKGFSKL